MMPEETATPLRVHHATTKRNATVRDRRSLADGSEQYFVKPDESYVLGTDDSDPIWWPGELVVEGEYMPAP